MNPKLLFLLVYLAVFIFYVIVETDRPSLKHALSKIILASLYLSFALVKFISNQLWNDPVDSIVVIALIFCWLGVVILIKYRYVGGILFWVANLIFWLAEIVYLVQRNIEIFFPILLGLLLFFLIMLTVSYVTKKWKVGAVKRKFGFYYLSSVTLQGSLAFVLLFYNPSLKAITVSIGLILFMLSDYALAYNEAHSEKSDAILRLNSILYFTGMLLVALSRG